MGAILLAWLLLFIFLHLLPNVAGDPLGLQFPAERLGVTLPLVLLSGAIALLLGVGLDLLAARAGGLIDRGLGGFSVLLSYLPPFWLGLLLALLLSGMPGFVPVSGFVPWSAGPLQALGSLLLPALALAIPHAGQLAAQLRTARGGEPGDDEVRTLRLAGLTDRAARRDIVRRRVLPRLPVLVGRLLASVLIGAVVVENVFYLPGLGRQVLGAALAHDLPTLRAGLFLLVAIAALLMLLSGLGRLAIEKRTGATA